MRWSGDARLLEIFCIQTVIRTSARRRNTSPVSVRPEFIASNVVKDELRLQSRIRGHITEVYSHLIADLRLPVITITIISLEENCISIHVGEMKLGALRLTM